MIRRGITKTVRSVSGGFGFSHVSSLGWEDPMEKGMATHSNILAWKIMDRGAQRATVHGVAKNRTQLSG